MRWIVWCGLFLAGVASADEAREGVLGRWASDGSIIEVSEQAGALSARVVALKDPVYVAEEEFGPVGAPRRDDRNPDEDLRNRPVLGMELLAEYAYDDGEWQGRIYDPESGNTYSSKMWRDGDNLMMRGYIGFSLLGRTATFVPVSKCDGNVPLMLDLAGLEGC